MRLTDITARQVPEVRAEMLTWMTEEGPTGWLQQLVTRARQAGQSVDHRLERDHRDRSGHQIRLSELFFVSSPLTDLAKAAGASLPDYRLHQEDLPAPVGLCVFGSSLGMIGDGDIRLVQWGPGPGGLTVSFWADASQFWSDVASEAGWSDADVITNCGPLAFMHAAAFPWSEVTHGWGTVSETAPDEEISAASVEQAERAMIATWLLMGQTLTRSEDVRPPRAAQRRLARAGADPLTVVRYTDLRRVRAVTGDDHAQQDASSRYEHQWVVRGHWRQHWFPSRQDHRPIWIDPHIKGPDGAPLLGGDRVQLLRR
jgi:hypothetical protein